MRPVDHDAPDTGPRGQACVASIVIPAYNEGRVLTRCLETLTPALQPEAAQPIEVVVVPNGCTDDTAAIARDAARRHPRLRVLELTQGSKVGALNAGDAAATAYPRIFLDADVRLSAEALEALVGTLTTTRAVVAAPRIRFRTERADPLVRSFYRVFEQLPYVRDGLIGLGVYGVSRAGRARFDRFPDVTADDLWIQRLFAPEERIVVDGTFEVEVPRTLTALLRVRTRVARGNAELDREDDERFASSTQGTACALIDLLKRRPGTLLDVACYVGVTLAARASARRRTRRSGDGPAWERDETTRDESAHGGRAAHPDCRSDR